MNRTESEENLLGNQDLPNLILNSESPIPSARTSLPVRFSNPENPSSEREIAELAVDNLLVKETDLISETENLLSNVSRELDEIDQSIQKINKQTVSKSDTQKQLEDIYKTNKLDWTEGQIPHENTMAENVEKQTNTQEEPLSFNFTEEELAHMIDQHVKDALRLAGVLQGTDRIANDQIGLQDALRLLPKSFDGQNPEQLENFLEKCEFAVTSTVPTAIPRLIRAIQTRLTGKAKQVTKYRTFETWEDLRDLLKSNLEPQRTTQHLYQTLYATKQKTGMDIFSYSKEIETLQNTIIEQETMGCSVEVAQALEQSVKRQVLQVFVEGLGELKDYIKARNPETLANAIRAAQEEEIIRKSSEESRKLYRKPLRTPSSSCHVCKKSGHWARDCRYNNQPTERPSENFTRQNRPSPPLTSTKPTNIVCKYCKKNGHTRDECRKLKYVTAKRNNPEHPDNNIPENHQKPGPSGGRPVGSIKSAVIKFTEPSQ